MSILSAVDDSWDITVKPGVTVDAGFFEDFSGDIFREKKNFAKAMKIILQSRIKLYASMPHRLYPEFIKTYHHITGELPKSVNLQDDEIKQSISIKIDLEVPEIHEQKFRDLMSMGLLHLDGPAALPFDCYFVKTGEKKKWTATNTLFGFYLIKVLPGVRL